MPATLQPSSWRFAEPSYFAFEAPAPAEGPFRVLLARAEFCPTPGCDCRDVRLSAVGLEAGSRLAEPSVTAGSIAALLDSARPLRALLELDSGLVEPDDLDGRVPLSVTWADELEAIVDGELLDLLQARWLAEKGLEPRTWRDVPWPTDDVSELLPWRSLHPDDRLDLYSHKDTWFQAIELYCANPECSCREARVEFVELLPKQQERLVGSVRLELPSLEIEERDCASEQRPLLDELLALYRARHRRLSERLTARRAEMMERGRAYIASLAQAPKLAAAKVGRNEPCPCGSGKKHKACCLGATPTAP